MYTKSKTTRTIGWCYENGKSFLYLGKIYNINKVGAEINLLATASIDEEDIEKVKNVKVYYYDKDSDTDTLKVLHDMNCPFCGSKLKQTSLYMDGNSRFTHKYVGALEGGKDRCPLDGETLHFRGWQAIIHLKQDLEQRTASERGNDDK